MNLTEKALREGISKSDILHTEVRAILNVAVADDSVLIA